MRIFSKRRTQSVVNGKTYIGNEIVIDSDNVVVDGVTVSTSRVPSINIEVKGDAEFIHINSGYIRCGNAGDIETVSGDVTCDDVTGNVKTVSGDVECGDVGGSVKTVSGDIERK